MSITRPVPKPGILDIAPYVPGKSGAKGSKVYKLSSNESPLGASPKAIAAFAAVGSQLELYPDGAATGLREAIAARYGLRAENIVCGAGSDEILQLLGHAYLREGDEAIYSQYGFMVYPIIIQANGAVARIAPEKNFVTDVDAVLALVSKHTRLVFIANPNNPTGTYLPFDEVKRLHAGLPRDVLLVLDAAYAEFVQRNDYDAGIALVAENENVVMTRTFSKIHGLAGLRIGWAYCPDHVADVLNRIRGPFNLGAPALAAGRAAIEDTEFVERAVVHNAHWLPWLTGRLQELGLHVTPSTGNFLLVHFPVEARRNAAAADAWLIDHGIVVRRMEGYGLPTALRITVGSEEACNALIAALKEFMA